MLKSWPKVRLGEVICEEREPVGSFDGDGLPVLGVTNVEGVTQTGVEASDDRSKYLRLRPGRFVYNPYRINVGSLGLSSDKQNGICSPAYVVFTPTDRIETKFLLFFLKSARGNQLINFHGNRGSVRSALRFDDLCQIEIPLPPLSEQRRIVARIEELAAQIAEARSLRHQAAEEAEAVIVASVSAWCFGKRPLNKFGQFLSEAKNGIYKPPMAWGRGLPCVRMYNIDGPNLNQRNLQLLDVSPEELETYGCKPGDLIFNRVNSAELVGKTGLVTSEFPLCTYESKNMRLRVDRCRALPEFAVLVLNSATVRSYYRQVLKQQCGMATLNQGHVREIPFPNVDVSEQRRIVAYLDGLQSQVDALKRLQSETAAELDALLPSVLDKAFKGEL